jgi:hypothetical protein
MRLPGMIGKRNKSEEKPSSTHNTTLEKCRKITEKGVETATKLVLNLPLLKLL